MRQLKITQSITNRRESHTLEKYFTEVSNVSMITPDEEVNLAQRIREGDQLALEKLVKSNLRFVVSVAKQYQNRSLPLNDLINEGNLGLIKAAKKFDETKGFKFISYAVWWIRQSIMQALAEQSRIVRLPMNKSGAINQIRRAYAELEQKYEREPTEEELADILDMKPNEIRNTLGAEVKQTSMDAPFGEEESGSLLDVLENQTTGPTDGQLVFNDSLKVETLRALSTLTAREREVIMMSFGIALDNPFTLDFSDLDNDGIDEIITANYGGGDPSQDPLLNNIRVYKFNQSSGLFEIDFRSNSPSAFYNIGLGATSILTQDFDGDGIKDITVAREDRSGNSFEIWKGNSDGTYTPHYASPIWTENELQFREFRIFDVNNDGFPDLVLRPFHYGTLYRNSSDCWWNVEQCNGIKLNSLIQINNGDGTFSSYDREELVIESLNVDNIHPYIENGVLHFLGTYTRNIDNNTPYQLYTYDIKVRILD